MHSAPPSLIMPPPHPPPPPPPPPPPSHALFRNRMRNLYDQPSSHPASSLAAEHVVIRRKHFLNGRQRVVFQLSTPLPRQTPATLSAPSSNGKSVTLVAGFTSSLTSLPTCTCRPPTSKPPRHLHSTTVPSSFNHRAIFIQLTAPRADMRG